MDLVLLGFTLLVLIGSVIQGQSITKPKYCGGKPADLVFVMDSSGSIGARDFEQQKEFIKGMVELFETDTGKIRVGVVSYSNWAFLEFHLNQYMDKAHINAHINEVLHYKGDTNTGSAISYMRDVMFNEHNGARDGVPRIAFVLTDGRSNDPWFTIQEAQKAHEENIAIFAIGVGRDISRHELEGIASEAEEGEEKYIFQVSDYTALNYIKELLAIRACEVKPPPRKYPTTTTEAPDLACRDTAFADIIYSLSPASSPSSTDKALVFYRELTSGLDISNDKIHIGMVPKDCDKLPEMNMVSENQKTNVLNELDQFINDQPITADVIKYMRRRSFSPKAGARDEAQRIGVIFVDEGDDLTKTKNEAKRAKDVHNIELFVIAVGRNLNEKKLSYIASEPTEEHLFIVPTYDHLPPILVPVRNAICPAP